MKEVRSIKHHCSSAISPVRGPLLLFVSMALPESAPIVVDPTLLSPEEDDSDDDEYEYHETETESFYVNLDLTSYHGPIRSPRRRQAPSGPSPTAPASRSLDPSVPTRSAPPDDNEDDDADDDIVGHHDPAVPEPDSIIQILDLHSHNPIVTYQNNVFSCSWADLLGTELLFTSPQPGQDDNGSSPPTLKPFVKNGKDFNLIAANSVRILGRKANLIPNSSSSSSSMPPATATPAAAGTDDTTTVPHHHPSSSSAPQTNQSRFLQRLANVKQSKGETDSVRTVFSAKRAQSAVEDRLPGWVRTEEQIAEIQRLHYAASQGDGDAMVLLEDLCARLGLELPEVATSDMDTDVTDD